MSSSGATIQSLFEAGATRQRHGQTRASIRLILTACLFQPQSALRSVPMCRLRLANKIKNGVRSTFTMRRGRLNLPPIFSCRRNSTVEGIASAKPQSSRLFSTPGRKVPVIKPRAGSQWLLCPRCSVGCLAMGAERRLRPLSASQTKRKAANPGGLQNHVLVDALCGNKRGGAVLFPLPGPEVGHESDAEKSADEHGPG